MGKYAFEFERSLVDLEERLEFLRNEAADGTDETASQVDQLEKQIEKLREITYSNLTPWQIVQLSRHPNRPTTQHYIESIIDDFVELHGDRVFGDDSAIIAGLGRMDGRSVAVIGQQKGRTARERVQRNFGQPHPEGYRKVLRVAKLAEKCNLPLITLVDTQGAFPGTASEERGISQAIAVNLAAFSSLRTPIVTVTIGEGGSGGALGIGVADRVLMLQNSYYSVITPEGCASILFGDSSRAEEAASLLKLTAEDLTGLGVVDGVVSEPLGGANRDPHWTAWELKKTLVAEIDALVVSDSEELVEKRYQKIRSIGVFMTEQGETIGSPLQMPDLVFP